MILDSDFSDYCRRLNLPENAVKYLQQVRSSGPSRRVRCGSDNVTAKYPSRKMGRAVPAESHTVELAFIYQAEYDEDVLEYYGQPVPIKLVYQSLNGRQVGVVHTPDFLLLTQQSIMWVECKPDEKMADLVTKMPRRYQPDGSGRWRCPPGEEVAALFNFSYRVWTPTETHPTLLRNLRFLEDYLCPDYPDVSNEIRAAVLDAVRREPGIRLSALVAQNRNWKFEQIFTLAGKGAIYIDLKAAPLTQPDLVRVSSSLAGALGGGEIPRRAGPAGFAVEQDTVPGELPDGGATGQKTSAGESMEPAGLGRRTGGMEYHSAAGAGEQARGTGETGGQEAGHAATGEKQQVDTASSFLRQNRSMFNLLKSKERIRQEKYGRAGLTPDHLIRIWRGCLSPDTVTARKSIGTEEWCQVAHQYYQRIQETIHFDHDDKFEFELSLQTWSRVYEEAVISRVVCFTDDEIKMLWEYIAVAIICGQPAAEAINGGLGGKVVRRLPLETLQTAGLLMSEDGE